MRDTFFCWLALLAFFSAVLGASVAKIEFGVLSFVDIALSAIVVAVSSYNVRDHYLRAANKKPPS